MSVVSLQKRPIRREFMLLLHRNTQIMDRKTIQDATFPKCPIRNILSPHWRQMVDVGSIYS